MGQVCCSQAPCSLGSEEEVALRLSESPLWVPSAASIPSSASAEPTEPPLLDPPALGLSQPLPPLDPKPRLLANRPAPAPLLLPEERLKLTFLTPSGVVMSLHFQPRRPLGLCVRPGGKPRGPLVIEQVLEQAQELGAKPGWTLIAVANRSVDGLEYSEVLKAMAAAASACSAAEPTPPL